MAITLKAKSTEYKTNQNDIWDIISLRVFGDEHAMSMVQDANFDERFVDAFEGGVILQVPSVVTLQNNLKSRKPTPDLAQLLPWLSPPL